VNRRHVVLVFLLVLLLAVLFRGERLFALGSSGSPVVAVAYDPAEVAAHPNLRDAWESELNRQGVPHSWIAEGDLALLGARSMPHHYPVVLLPDGLTRWVSDGLAGELLSFAKNGGTLVVVADAGTRTDDGHVLTESVFGDMVDNGSTANLIYVPSSAGSLMVSGHPETIQQTAQRAMAAIASAERTRVAANPVK